VPIITQASPGANLVTVGADDVTLGDLCANAVQRSALHQATYVSYLVSQMVKLQHADVAGAAINTHPSNQVRE